MPQLTWLGDQEAKRAARKVPYRLLDPVEQVGDPASGNLLIRGDNLEALKALLPFYAGRVKCIFIGPPYNTKSAFEHYDDNLERQPIASFWLQTSTDRFYPDFVAELTDGRILVVEYKGAHLYDAGDAREKRDIGKVWASASEERCLFGMVTGAEKAGKTVGGQLRDALRS